MMDFFLFFSVIHATENIIENGLSTEDTTTFLQTTISTTTSYISYNNRKFSKLYSIEKDLKYCSRHENIPWLKEEDFISTRIYSGLPTQLDDWPSVVRLNVFVGDYVVLNKICTGSIVDEFYILTNGQCCKFASRIEIVFNEADVVVAQDIFLEPEFEKTWQAGRFDVQELCLLKHSRKPINKKAACLSDLKPNSQSKCWIAGYGSSFKTSETMLASMAMKILTSEFCENNSKYSYFGLSGLSQSAYFCAVSATDKEALSSVNIGCDGDLGAPLICNIDEKATIVGVLSIETDACGSNGLPQIFASVSDSYQWIQSVISGNSFIKKIPFCMNNMKYSLIKEDNEMKFFQKNFYKKITSLITSRFAPYQTRLNECLLMCFDDPICYQFSPSRKNDDYNCFLARGNLTTDIEDIGLIYETEKEKCVNNQIGMMTIR
jgi:hypothetical protein